MPIYEYECDPCGFRFEKKQKFDEEPVTICPECKGKARRVFHPAPVIFKGSGFYITDSRKGSNPASQTSKEKSKEEAPSGVKPEGE